MQALVKHINADKAGIEEFVVSTYQTRQERFEALRAECPGGPFIFTGRSAAIVRVMSLLSGLPGSGRML
ncbi:DNA replication terminus site-binding protein [Xenorhabdus sp. TH1]|uniref:DNA replication terminus site-binding protein n=1 Tax=Xenorhabdus sp. TH1 TaxID=3130166 RepID=UPI0030D14F65